MRVSDIWEELVEVTGSCQDDVNYRALTRAIELLANKGLFDPCLATLDFIADGGHLIALPRDVKTPLRLNINNNPSFARTRLFEFQPNSDGSNDGPEIGWQWHERGYSPIQNEVRLPSALSYVVTTESDIGKSLRVRGTDVNGYERDETIIGAITGAVPTVSVYGEVRSVVREATEKEALLYSDTGPIARYYADEEQPEYRVVKLSQSGVAVRMLYRKHVFKITSQDDIIPLHSAMAVIRAVDAVRLYQRKQYEAAAAVLEEAKAMITEEQASRDENATVSSTVEIQTAINTNITTNDVLIVADIYDIASDVLGPIGRAKIFDRITDAVNALQNKTQWESIVGEAVLYRRANCVAETPPSRRKASDGYFTLPRYVGAVLAVNTNGEPGIPRNRWFEYHLNGTGETRFASCGTWDDKGETVIINGLPRTHCRIDPTQVLAIPDNALDEGKLVTIYGIEKLADGREAEVWRDGKPGWICPCRSTSYTLPSTAPAFVRIDRITRAATSGFVRLIGYTAETYNVALVGDVGRSDQKAVDVAQLIRNSNPREVILLGDVNYGYIFGYTAIGAAKVEKGDVGTDLLDNELIPGVATIRVVEWVGFPILHGRLTQSFGVAVDDSRFDLYSDSGRTHLVATTGSIAFGSKGTLIGTTPTGRVNIEISAYIQPTGDTVTDFEVGPAAGFGVTSILPTEILNVIKTPCATVIGVAGNTLFFSDTLSQDLADGTPLLLDGFLYTTLGDFAAGVNSINLVQFPDDNYSGSGSAEGYVATKLLNLFEVPDQFSVGDALHIGGSDLARTVTAVDVQDHGLINVLTLSSAITADPADGVRRFQAVSTWAGTVDANLTSHYGDFKAAGKLWSVPGNHDWGDIQNNPSGLDDYLAYFDFPGNERYFSKVFGAVEVFFLDSDNNEPDGNTVGSDQYDWFVAAVAASTSKWKVVVFHHSPKTSTTTAPKTEMLWDFAALGIHAVVTAHAHAYERIEEDGVIYITCGTGSDSLVSFFTADSVLVSGGLSPDATGAYARYGTHNGKPSYSNGTYAIWYFEDSNWVINPLENYPNVLGSDGWQFASSNATPIGSFTSVGTATGTAVVTTGTPPNPNSKKKISTNGALFMQSNERVLRFQFKDLTGQVLDERELAYTLEIDDELLLGYWYPDELEPRYKIIKVAGCCSTRIRIRYRKRTPKISSLYDVINLRSRLAMENMLRALANQATDPSLAASYELLAVNYLEEEQNAMNPVMAGGLQFDPGSSPGFNQNIQ